MTTPASHLDVLRPGLLTTVQDWPGRVGYWHVGVPPSGPMDDLSFRLGNRVLGNAEGAPGLECTLGGPVLRFSAATWVCVTGAPTIVAVDGVSVSQWRAVPLAAGSVLDVGAVVGPGMRCYVLVAGGIEVAQYLGSAATFTLGKFGGATGAPLRAGDRLALGRDHGYVASGVPAEEQPVMTRRWELAVTEGPHGAPEFFTRTDFDTILATDYEVHFNSDRTGVRLIGPKPRWARTDGGEAGLHPSNIHDTAYSVGALDFTGDTPILLGPDGPSLGGFVCPVTVVAADRWKLGQLAPGDRVRFVPVRSDRAAPLRATGLARRAQWPFVPSTGGDGDDGVLARAAADDATPVTYRRAGDDGLLVEYGDMTLDLGLRARVHALHRQLLECREPGITELTPGVRSLQVRFDPDRLATVKLLRLLQEAESVLPSVEELVVPSRTVHLPLSWDDPATREAITRYMHGVRADAPWCPWNIEFIRRMNGLATVREVFDIVFAAEYLVLGLGDVYLGAPVATPIDPRHRLVTTKYNPARTWTPENAVGIGGAYLCVYGLEGPGGYQFVGRTTQVWSHGRDEEKPWRLDYFDRIRWYPVTAEELLELRADFAAGNGALRTEDGEFRLTDYRRFLAANADSIADFRARQGAAFTAERDSWRAAGELAGTKGLTDA
ncbi:5-oxoprolinase/urea amidolyase family protein [Nocardia sp. CDC159]|uniref:5-oxoprolinase/urea amidolyase family protein n=1 Tax=Nocardia pulmonis TaxID=2951408 RepID=A0A9X2E7Q6_9NOCA|nr:MULTISPECIES: 5-oxoprolinase/urea amidolyase family protein [Nocardia]MCM6775115.1 5-oxoprolinase/urea amidolyase family protein [Nocardia pulmonis]MCM6789585.1 5-oxoprolinase/urea amidolyase family protein [Nocardia sp. CDC159]